MTCDGEPVEGVTVTFLHADPAVTDASGVATSTYEPQNPGIYAFIAFAMGAQSTAVIRTAVSAMAVEANGQRYYDGDKIHVCKGASGATLTLTAIPNPDSGAGWPTGQPVWDGTTQSPSIDVPIDTASSSANGTSHTVTGCDSSVTVSVVVCEVDATPIPVPGNNPDISPDMCLNAQANYKKARWKVTVKPSGTTATFLVNMNAIGSATGVVDGQEIEVTPNTPFGPGEYGVQVFHDDLSSCYITKNGYKVFQFEFQDVSMVPGPTTPQTPPTGNSWKKSTATAAAPMSFSTEIAISLASFDAPQNMAAFSQTATYKYKMVTNPAGAFSGKVECPTTFTTTIAAGCSALTATGMLAVHGIGASDSSMSFTDAIIVSGLLGGNGPVTRPFSVAAPTFAAFPLDATTMDGTTVWNNNLALYTVDATVSAESKMTMSAARGGAAPLSPTALGFAKNSGFTRTVGAFKIKP